MSRSGNSLIRLPKGIQVKEIFYKGRVYLIISGYYKVITLEIPAHLYIYKQNNSLMVLPLEKEVKSKSGKAFWGYYRAYLETVFDFLELGYLIILELKGVGFRLQLEGQSLKFYLGFSHLKTFPIPKNIFLKIGNKKETELHLFGYNKQYLCQIAAQIKMLKVPDLYKGKGIFFFDEVLTLKQGKQVDS